MVVLILFFLFATEGLGQTYKIVKHQYYFNRKPFISPMIIKDLVTWISDEGEQVVAINLPESMGTNRYFGDFEATGGDSNENPVVTHTDSAACKKSPCPFGPPFFSYSLIGKTPSGIYVLLTVDSGGGTGRFENLLLVKLVNSTGLSFDSHYHSLVMNRKRLLIKRLKGIPLADSYRGGVGLKGDTLYIGHDPRFKSGDLAKDRIIVIKP
jgi:hypothetical protein